MYTVDSDSGSAARTSPGAPLRTLRRIVQQRKPMQIESEAPAEHCDLCGLVLPTEHHHLLDLTHRGVICACQACAVLFNTDNAGSAKYRLIPARYLALPDFTMTDEQWDALLIPVNMAFFFSDSKEQQVKAFYPGPAGATESLLNMEHWTELVEANPILRLLEPDVEALLVNRLEQTRAYYIVPIDSCYRLVGMIRVYWRGLSGGEEVWQAIHNFFAELQTHSQAVSAEEASHLAQSWPARQGGNDARSKL